LQNTSASFLRQLWNSKISAFLTLILQKNFIERLLKNYWKESATFLKYCQKIFEVANQILEFLYRTKQNCTFKIHFYLLFYLKV